MIPTAFVPSSPAPDRIRACAKRPIIRHARVTIELLTPLHMGSGSEDSGSDAGVSLDNNGLVTIPGSGIKGVLRHAYRDIWGTYENLPDEDSLFGCQIEGTDDGNGGRFAVSWARVHDSRNRPVDRPLTRDEIRDDAVLRLAAAPELRDHVRINHLGTADGAGKFDELAAAPGLRFTFFLEMHGGVDEDGAVNSGDQIAWNLLLQRLDDPLLRFGGKNRRGFGAFAVVDLQQRTFRLDGCAAKVEDEEPGERNPAAEWEAWLAMPSNLSDPLPAVEGASFFTIEDFKNAFDANDKPWRRALSFKCIVKPEPDVFWMVAGQGSGSASDSSPLKIRRVLWNGDSGEVKQVFVVPGTSIKGCLRHRAAFHWRRLNEVWADADDVGGLTAGIPKDLQTLFGTVETVPLGGDADYFDPSEVAVPGLLFVDDVIAPPGAELEPDMRNHVAIDRVLGGAMDHLLFDDHPLKSGTIEFTVRVVRADSLEDGVIDSLKMALDDLCSGRLSLGAHGGRGYGFFQGNWEELTVPVESEPEASEEE